MNEDSNIKVNAILDQMGHFLWAFFVIWVAMRWPGEWWAGMLAAFMLCMPRELVDQWPVNDYFDTSLDMFFFVLAGLIAAILI